VSSRFSKCCKITRFPQLDAKVKTPLTVVGDVSGKIAIMVDDIIDEVGWLPFMKMYANLSLGGIVRGCRRSSPTARRVQDLRGRYARNPLGRRALAARQLADRRG